MQQKSGELNSELAKALANIPFARMWRHLRLTYPSINIYISDGIHLKDDGNKALYGNIWGNSARPTANFWAFYTLIYFVGETWAFDCRSEWTRALKTRRGIFKMFHNFARVSTKRAKYTAFLIYLPFQMERLHVSANSFNHFWTNLNHNVDSCVFVVTKDGRPLYHNTAMKPRA